MYVFLCTLYDDIYINKKIYLIILFLRKTSLIQYRYCIFKLNYENYA